MSDRSALVHHAIDLASANGSRGALPFGAVIALDGRTVGTGVNVSVERHDPTAHAEVEAIRDACRSLGVVRLDGATLVTSCEPCALCQAAAAVAGVARIVYAAPRELVTATLGRTDHPLETLLGVMQHELRRVGGRRLVHAPTGREREPFERYLEAMGRR